MTEIGNNTLAYRIGKTGFVIETAGRKENWAWILYQA
jgi:hypothetical protein